MNQALRSVTIPIVGGTPSFASPAVLTAQPGGLTAIVTGNTITITGAPAAMASSISVTVTDAAGATASKTLPITVNPPVAQTFHVNSALDAPSLGAHDPTYDLNGDISLRSAIMAASDDSFGTQAVTDTIVVPADDYFLYSTLTISGNMNIVAAPGVAPAQILILGESTTDTIDVTRGQVSISGVEISNAPKDSTAGILNTGATLAIANCLFTGNNTSAIANESILAIANCTFINNTTQFSGGAVVNFNGTATIDDSTFNLNTANQAGAVYNGFGRMTIRGSTFTSNMSTFNSGGAVENNQGVVTVVDSTFVSNSSAFDGGAISSTGPLTVVASTFTLNGAAGQGGGIFSIDNGLYFSPSTLLVDDLIDGNYGASLPAFVDDFTGNGLLAASHNNLIGACYNGAISSGSNGNQLNVSLADAGLAPLGYYGGATQTIDLQPDSLAIGTGGAVASLAANALDPNATSLLVDNGMVFSAKSLPVLTSGSYFTIQIGGDEMAVTGVQLNADGSATLTVTRGVNKASAPHLAGAGVYLATDQTGLETLIGAPTDVGSLQSWVPLQVNTAVDDSSLVGSGELSLRDAVNRANENSASSTTFIAFDPAVFAVATIISLSSNLTFGTPGLTSNIELFAPASGLEIASATPSATDWVVVSAGSTVALAGEFKLGTTLDVQGQSYGLPGGIFTVAKTGTLHATQGTVLVDGTFSADGQTDIDDSVDFIVNSDGVFNVAGTSRSVTINGTLDVFGKVVLQSGFTDTDGNEAYGGLLNVYGDLRIEQFGAVTDGGTLVVEAADIFGKLAILPAFTDTSRNEQAAGYLQIFFGTVNISPTAAVADAGTITNGYINFDTAATLNVLGSLSISQSSVDTNGVAQPGGFLDDFGVVNVGVTGSHQGTLNDTGQLKIESGGKLGDGNLVAVYPGGNVDIFGTFTTIQSPAGPGSPGVLHIFSYAAVNVEGQSGPSNSPGRLDDSGQVTVDIVASLTDMGNVTVESVGAVSDQSRFLVTGASASLSVNAGGTFTISSDSRLTVNQLAIATILGELDVNSLCEVVVDTGASIALSGKLAIGQLGSLDVAATGGIPGNFTVEPVGNLALSNRGDISVEGFFSVASGGSVTVVGDFTVAPGGTVSDSGIFGVTGATSDLEVASADDTRGYGDFTVEAVLGASLSIAQNATATIDGMLDVEGKASVSGGATLTDTADVLIGGSLDVAGAMPNSLAGTLSATGGSTFDLNHGGIATIEGNFTNTSTTLEINGIFVENTLTVGPSSVIEGDGSLTGAVIVDSGGIDLPGFRSRRALHRELESQRRIVVQRRSRPAGAGGCHGERESEWCHAQLHSDVRLYADGRISIHVHRE